MMAKWEPIKQAKSWAGPGNKARSKLVQAVYRERVELSELSGGDLIILSGSMNKI